MRNQSLKSSQSEFVVECLKAWGEDARIVTRTEIIDLCEETGMPMPHWLTTNPKYRAGRGEYALPLERLDDSIIDEYPWIRTQTAPAPAAPAVQQSVEQAAAPVPAAPAAGVASSFAFMGGQTLVPERMDTYVPFGNHKKVKTILASRKFYPIYMQGLSGNGKTTTFEQVCAELKREFFRVNITPETDEDDLLGGFRLIDGNTVFQYGPVVEAMQRGAVLLLDEVDLGTIKIMCLQSVLEGKGVFLKKINKWITPADGFTVVLSGNTKGQGNGDHDDKFIGANVMNEAFLDRIPCMMEQDYPDAKTEGKILSKVMKSSDCDVDKDFIGHLTKWAGIVRKTFNEGAIEDVITTRRLVQVVQGFCIHSDRAEAIQDCIARFDKATQESFLSLYEKIDADVALSPEEVDPTARPDDLTTVEFVAVTVPFDEKDNFKATVSGIKWNPANKTWKVPVKQYQNHATWIDGNFHREFILKQDEEAVCPF